MHLNYARLHSTIILLAFHPTRNIIAAATSSFLVVWDHKEEDCNKVHDQE